MDGVQNGHPGLDPGRRGCRHVDLGMAQGRIQQRRHFPGQTQHTQAVGPVGGNGDFQDHVRQTQGLGKVPAHRQILGNLHQTRMIGGQSQLIFRQEHAFREDAPELGGLELLAAGQDGPGRRKGIKHPRRHVGRAAHHPVVLAAGGHLRHLQPVRLGVAFHAQDFAHHHPGKSRGHVLHGLDFQTRHGQTICQGLGLDAEVHKISQPVERQSHNRLI